MALGGGRRRRLAEQPLGGDASSLAVVGSALDRPGLALGEAPLGLPRGGRCCGCGSAAGLPTAEMPCTGWCRWAFGLFSVRAAGRHVVEDKLDSDEPC